MKLVVNASAVAKYSYSMLCAYFVCALILVPEAVYGWLGYDLDPILIGRALIVGAIGIIIGRVVDQGIAEGLRPKYARRFIGLLVLIFALVIGVSARAAPASDAEFARVAVPLVAKWEGKRNTAYRDVVGVWTICYGHTKTARPGMVLSDRECDALLADELLEYRDGLHAYFSADTKRQRLPAARDAAFTSLAYNVGIRGAGRSTATRRLNAGHISRACDALTWWNKAGGKIYRGLVRRRSDERDLCMRGV